MTIKPKHSTTAKAAATAPIPLVAPAPAPRLVNVTSVATGGTQDKRILVTAILDALKALKKRDVPLTVQIARQLEAIPEVTWSPQMKDEGLLRNLKLNTRVTLDMRPTLGRLQVRKERAMAMLHRLIGFAGGLEIDIEAISGWVYPKPAALRNLGGFSYLFHIPKGKFVQVNCKTGDVRLKRTGEMIAYFYRATGSLPPARQKRLQRCAEAH